MRIRKHPAGEVTYRGYGSGSGGGGTGGGGGGGLVAVFYDGLLVGVLRHVRRHSLGGMGWGHSAGGADDLAMSLLVDALGDAARCRTCAGTGRVVYLEANDAIEAFDLRRHDPTGATSCGECDAGLVDLPYHPLKFDLVEGLSTRGWMLTRQQILDWYAQYVQDSSSKFPAAPPDKGRQL